MAHVRRGSVSRSASRSAWSAPYPSMNAPRWAAASAGSACRAGVHEPSHVALAMGWGAEHARGTLRCSVGWDTTAADVSAFAAVVGDAVGRARRAHRS